MSRRKSFLKFHPYPKSMSVLTMSFFTMALACIAISLSLTPHGVAAQVRKSDGGASGVGQSRASFNRQWKKVLPGSKGGQDALRAGTNKRKPKQTQASSQSRAKASDGSGAQGAGTGSASGSATTSATASAYSSA